MTRLETTKGAPLPGNALKISEPATKPLDQFNSEKPAGVQAADWLRREFIAESPT